MKAATVTRALRAAGLKTRSASESRSRESLRVGQSGARVRVEAFFLGDAAAGRMIQEAAIVLHEAGFEIGDAAGCFAFYVTDPGWS